MSTMPAPREAVGVAQTGLHDSLYRAILWGVAGWQTIVIAAVMTSDTVVSTGVLVAMHAVIGLLALASQRFPRIGVVAGVSVLAAAPLDLYASRSILDPAAFTTVWTMNIAILGSVGAIRGWRGTMAGLATSAYSAVIFRLLQPDWTVLHGTMITTGITMVAAATVLISYLYRFADASDAEAANAVLAHYSVSVARTAGREAADLARTMHDTAINTLAAVASGGAAVSDIALVRDRCARDVMTLERLLAGQQSATERTDLVTIGSDVGGIEVVRRGLTATDLGCLESEIPVEVLRAMRSAGNEVVRNAARHSGARQVVVSIRHGEALVIEISDSGIGFDGQVTTGRGLSESVMARVADVGAEAMIHSSVGHGTTVKLVWRSDAALPPDLGADSSPTLADGVRRWACWAWAAGVVGVGFVIEYAPRPGLFTATYVALALVGLASLASWWIARSGVSIGGLPVWWSWVLVALVPVTFTLGYEGVKDAPYLWQSLGSSPLLVILLVYQRRVAMWSAALVLALSAAALAAVVADGDVSRAGLVVVGAAPQLGVVAGWVVFHRIIGEVAEQSDMARREAAASRADLAAQQAVRAARRRWQEAGAERALGVLRRLARGESDPQDPVTRRRCSEEESALRQVMQLSPSMVHLGPCLARALADARERDVELTVRTGDVDTPSARDAEILGTVIDEFIADASPGSAVTLGLFGDERQGRALLVGTTRLELPVLPADWTRSRQRLGEQELLEITWPLRAGVTG